MQRELFGFTFFSIFLIVIHDELICFWMNFVSFGFESGECSFDFNIMDILDLIVLWIVRLDLMTIGLCIGQWVCGRILLGSE